MYVNVMLLMYHACTHYSEVLPKITLLFQCPFRLTNTELSLYKKKLHSRRQTGLFWYSYILLITTLVKDLFEFGAREWDMKGLPVRNQNISCAKCNMYKTIGTILPNDVRRVISFIQIMQKEIMCWRILFKAQLISQQAKNGKSYNTFCFNGPGPLLIT